MKTNLLNRIRTLLKEHANASDAVALRRFFKTGPGKYGEGDRFIGVRVPAIRRIASQFRNLSINDLLVLIRSEFHEERLLALIILVQMYRQGSCDQQAEIYRVYLENTHHINNWDLIDASAEHIVGPYLKNRSRKPLHNLARSESIWERRIAIMSTFHFIKNGEFEETLTIAKTLISDTEDLIHKSVGWMLREVGKRNRDAEEIFLRRHYRSMPRTMLRYAIEKFPENIRQQYLKGTVRS
jgi:3-methyladenine DNA glycosylase AlkD